MNAVDISRWQFGITTVYHFIFVPLTIGLAPLIAIMQTVWVATGNTAWYRLTKFFGDIFGAPLAMEGLFAFFFESTFIGLWIFGWSRLPKLIHLACIWIVAFGVN